MSGAICEYGGFGGGGRSTWWCNILPVNRIPHPSVVRIVESGQLPPTPIQREREDVEPGSVTYRRVGFGWEAADWECGRVEEGKTPARPSVRLPGGCPSTVPRPPTRPSDRRPSGGCPEGGGLVADGALKTEGVVGERNGGRADDHSCGHEDL